MFNIIIIESRVSDFPLSDSIKSCCAFTYIKDKTLLLCFNMNQERLSEITALISKQHNCALSPYTCHYAYKKHYYYHELSGLVSTEPEGAPVSDFFFFNKEYTVFFECHRRGGKVRELVRFRDLNSFKQMMREYDIQYLVPFYFTDIKKFISENRIKLKDLSLLYILEHKTLEGKKY